MTLKKSRSWILPSIYVCVLAVLYTVFHNRYLPEYIDDAWTLSWAFNWLEKGVVYDPVFGYLQGDGGSALFSRLFVYIYGLPYHWLNAWGYRGLGFLLSTLFTMGGLACWMGVWKELKYDRGTLFWFAGVFLLLELYFGMAHKIRVDALTFCFASLSLYLFARKRYFFSALAGMLGAEVHPYGLVFILYALAWLVPLIPDMKKDPKPYLKGFLLFLAGLAAGAGIYLLLHFPWLKEFGQLQERAGGNALFSYFFVKRYSWRHWPELAVILLTFVLFFVNRMTREHLAVLTLTAAGLLITVIIARGNSHYVVYVYPPIIMMMLLVFQKIGLRPLLLSGLLVFQLSQYGYLFWKQRNYSQGAYLTEIRSRVRDAEEQLDLSGSEKPVLFGNSNAWFAFYDRDFRAYGYWYRAKLKPEEWPGHFLMIENSDFRKEYKKAFDSRIDNRFERRILTTFSYYDGTDINICLYQRKPAAGP